MSRSTLTVKAALLFSSAFLVAGSALAQVPTGSQVPPGETVERKGPQAQFSFPAAQGLRAPQGADGIRFQLGVLTIDGALPQMAVQTKTLLPAKGAEVSVSDIYKVAGDIQQAYLNAGYPLVRVLVPAQDLDRANGNVTIRVVAGFVESVDVSALPKRVQKPVIRILSNLIDKSPITSANLEHYLLIAGEVAGVSLRTALSPGNRTGATKLVLTGDYRLLQGAIAVDNRLVEDLGGEQVTLSASLNSLLGMGDRFVGTIAFAPDKPSLSENALRRYGSLCFLIPLASNGLEIAAELVGTTSTPKGESAALALTSEFAKASVFATLPIQRRRDQATTAKLSLEAAFEQQNTGLLGFDVALFTDRTRVLRASLEGYRTLPMGFQLNYEIQLSQGLDALGARSKKKATFLNPLPRLDADASFSKADVMFMVQQNFGTRTSASLALSGTTGFGDPLLRSEQASIIGGNMVSGPPSGSVVGDDTFAARFELRHRLGSGAIVWTPYAFGAAGEAKLQRPTTLEVAKTQASSAGIGAEVFLRTADQRWRGRVEWSKTQFSGQRRDDDNLSVSVVSRF